MIEELNKKLIRVKSDWALRNSIAEKLKQATAYLDNERKRAIDLEEVLSQEAADVEKIENLTINAIFLTMLGKKKERLEREKDEYLIALFNYEQCRESIAILEAKVAELQTELHGMSSVDDAYQSALQEKATFISNNKEAHAEKLIAIAEQYADQDIEMRQITEAIGAGKNVIAEMAIAEKALKVAIAVVSATRSAGAATGFVEMMVMHQKDQELTKATESITRVQGLVYRFELELSDVGFRMAPDVPNLRLSEWELIANVFFSNLVSDLAISESLADSLCAVVNLKTQAEVLVSLLEQKLVDTREFQRQLAAKWRNTVESA